MSRSLRAALVACALAAGTLAHATTVLPLSEEQLVAASQHVVQATVVDIEVVTRDVSPGVFTDVRVRVDEVLAGSASHGQTLTLRIPGGRSADRAVIVPGMPGFAAGEQVVLFLEALPDAWADEGPFYLPMGLEQGVWRSDADGIWMPAAPAHGPLGQAEPGDLHGRSLEQLRELAAPETP